MLHLFNSCYVFPYALFDPSVEYVIVGENYDTFASNVENSFYYNNVNVKQCYGRFATYEDLINSNVFFPYCNHKEKFRIYCDDETMMKFFTAKIKTHVYKFDESLFFDLSKLFGVRLKAKSKNMDSTNKEALNLLADKFINLNTVPNVSKFDFDQYWVWENAGIEWKLANRKCDVPNNYSSVLTDLVNRYVYSFYNHARENYLSRKEGGWATDKNNEQFRTVVSMKDLYMEMRKEIPLHTDPLLLQFFEEGITEQLINDPRFLMLLRSDKIDIWLIRWLMSLPENKIKQLELIA